MKHAHAVAIPAPGSTDFDTKLYRTALSDFRSEVFNSRLLSTVLHSSLDEVTKMHLYSEGWQ